MASKVAGTEDGVTEPEATFSPCFGGPFMVWHPAKYAELLASKIKKHGSQVWLVNTGWTGGPYGVGSRMKLEHTRAIVDAIHSGTLGATACESDPLFGFEVPTSCPGVPQELLIPRNTWSSPDLYDQAARKLGFLFKENFARYEDGASDEIVSVGPRL